MKKLVRTLFSPDCYKMVLFVVCVAGVCPLLGIHMDRYLKLLHIYAAAVIVFDLLGEKRILKNKGRTILFVFVLCYGITLLCNPNLLGFSGLSNFCYYFACLALVYSYGEDSAKWNRLTSAVVVALITAANLVGIWMFYSKFYLQVPDRGCIGIYPSQNRLSGLFGNPNVLGMVCLVAICLCAIRVSQSDSRRTKALYAAAGAVNFITLLLANSRTQIYSVVLLCMVLVFMEMLRRGKGLKSVLLAALAAALAGVAAYFGGCLIQRILSLFDVNYAYYLEHVCNEDLLDEAMESTIFRSEDSSALNGRTDLWRIGLKVFVSKPLFGCGMDNLNATLAQIGLEALPVAGSLHSSYVEILADFGVAGFLCFAALVVVVMKNTIRFFRYGDRSRWREGAVLLACVAAFALDAVADSTLIASIYPTSTAFWFIASQFMALLEFENRKTRHHFMGPLCLLEEKHRNRCVETGRKVCFVNDSMGGGGAEQILVNVANALQENGYDVTVITLWSGEVLESRLNEKIELRTMDPFDLLFFKRVQHWVNRHCMPRRLYNWLFLDGRYDYTIAFQEGLTTRLVADTRLKAGAKRYAWVHIDLIHQNWVLPYYQSAQEQKQSYCAYDRVFCVSDVTRAAFIEVIGCESTAMTLYNLVDTDRVVRMGQEPCPIERPAGLLVSAIGRLNDQKGFDRLLPIVAKLRENGVALTLWILGEGGKRAALEEQIRQLKLDECVKLLGFQSNPYCYAAQADAFVLSSRAEGYPTVITENLLLGKPIVATLCSGVREQLGDDEYGIATDNDEDSLYDGLYRMLTSEELRNHYAEKALERGREMSYDVLLGKLLEQF